jgi:hypothetical protein
MIATISYVQVYRVGVLYFPPCEGRTRTRLAPPLALSVSFGHLYSRPHLQGRLAHHHFSDVAGDGGASSA